MKEVKNEKLERIRDFFLEYKWNYLADAVLDGYFGNAVVDHEDNPNIAALSLTKLDLKILGGDHTHPNARQYIQGLPHLTALIPASPGWEKLIKREKAGKLIELPRYAFTSENLNQEHLGNQLNRLPDEYSLHRLDLSLAQELFGERSEFSSDHMLNFESPEDFIERGFGFCILKDDQIVSVATTFTICDRGIEIQINTRDAEQGKGLGTVVAAQMLMFSLENNLVPNWDAANKRSARMAHKLGYTPQGTYAMYLIVRSRMWAVFGAAMLRIKGFFNR